MNGGNGSLLLAPAVLAGVFSGLQRLSASCKLECGMNGSPADKFPVKQAELPAVRDAEWLGAKQVATEFGMDENTVYRWWHEGLPTGREIPRRYMRRRGFAGYLFHPALIDFIRAEQDSLD